MSVATTQERAMPHQATLRGAQPWRRLLWKEVRTYQWFFAALLGFGLFLHFVGLFWAGWESLSFLMAMMFLAGVIGTGFSREHEVGTYLWLRSQPLSARHVIGSKLLVGVLGAALMTAVFTAMFALRYGKVELASKFVCDLLVAVLELSAWSLLLSLTDRQPLRALVVAGCIAATIGFGLVLGAEAVYGLDAPRRWGLTWLRLGIASVVMLGAVGLSFRWHRHGLTGGALWGLRSRRRPRNVVLRPQPGAIGSLARLTLRQSWWLVFPAALVALSIGRGPGILPSLTLFSGVCGVLTFATLGRERLQLAIHGANPRTVWLVRIAVLTLPLALTLAILGAMHDTLPQRVSWLELVAIAIVVYCANHLVSIRASNSLMAIGLTIPTTLVTGLLVGSCWHGGVPFWVLVIPFVVLSTGASLFMIRRWLLCWDDRRTNWLHRAVTWGAVLLWLTGIAVYRWQQFPLLSPGERAQLPTFQSIDQATWRAQQQELLELGHNGQWQALATNAQQVQVLPDPEKAEAQEAYNHEFHDLFDRGLNQRMAPDVKRELLQAQIRWSRRSLYGSNAYRNLHEWTHAESTSDEDLRLLRNHLLDHPPEVDTAVRKVAWNRAMLHRAARLDAEGLAYLGIIIESEVKMTQVIGALAFWERWRLSRLIDQHALKQVERLRHLSEFVRQRRPIERQLQGSDDANRIITFAGSPEAEYPIVLREHRANILRLEAVLHARKHGEVPESIEELPHGADPDFVDPFTAKPFEIDRAGDRPLLISSGSKTDYSGHDFQIRLTREAWDE